MNHLQLVDPDTGELIAPGCRQCHEHTAKIAGLEADLESLMKQLAATIRQVDALKRTRDQERLNHKSRKQVEAVFRDWQEVCGKEKSKLGNDRFDVIVARLNNGYTPEHFHLAAVGAKHNNPWRKKGEGLMLEIETYARNSRWLELFANAGAEWQNRVQSRTRNCPGAAVTARGVAHKEDPS